MRQTGAIAFALSGLVNERIEARKKTVFNEFGTLRGRAGEARHHRRRARPAARAVAKPEPDVPAQGTFRHVAFVRGPLPLLGPAFVAAIAYVDPGNFATNITAGSRFGYLLVWVMVVSNLMAMLIQYLSAKAGIATGKNLPELCRDNFPRPVTRGLWVQAEIVAIATDLAEVLGGAIALYLLFGLPLLGGRADHRGRGVRAARPAEPRCPAVRGGHHRPAARRTRGVPVQPDRRRRRPWRGLAGLTPRFEGTDTLLLATGMLGATVMPHVIYLHGALTQNRFVRTTEQERLASCTTSASTW